jgi:hypothetical protein
MVDSEQTTLRMLHILRADRNEVTYNVPGRLHGEGYYSTTASAAYEILGAFDFYIIGTIQESIN